MTVLATLTSLGFGIWVGTGLLFPAWAGHPPARILLPQLLHVSRWSQPPNPSPLPPRRPPVVPPPAPRLTPPPSTMTELEAATAGRHEGGSGESGGSGGSGGRNEGRRSCTRQAHARLLGATRVPIIGNPSCAPPDE